MAFFDTRADWRFTSQHARYSGPVERKSDEITVNSKYCTVTEGGKYEGGGVGKFFSYPCALTQFNRATQQRRPLLKRGGSAKHALAS